MLNNDVLRSLRYTLKVNEFELAHIVKMGGGDVTQAEINTFIKKKMNLVSLSVRKISWRIFLMV
jgi:uncharacterized protein YehS (DUF1456 family)